MRFAPPPDEEYDDCEFLGCPDEDWQGYDHEDWMDDKYYMAQLKRQDFRRIIGEAIKNQGELGDYQFRNETVVSKSEDLESAFMMVYDVFRNNVAYKLAEYYIDEKKFVDVVGDAFGKTYPFGATYIDLDKIYRTMDESPHDHEDGFPDIDETNSIQRAIFISSVMFHEFLHGEFHLEVSDQNEGEAWAAHVWYIRHAGGHAYLEKFATEKAMATEYIAGQKRYEKIIGSLDKSPELVTYMDLTRLFD